MEIEGVLPGGLNVRRRAPRLARRLRGDEPNPKKDPLSAIDWVTMWAMAVNEENAAGGRVVTAPTNGAAGVIPAIAHYYLKFVAEGLSEEEKRAGLLRYFLSAAAIGILYKENASISGAEVGCQGEVGVACSMAAGGLVAAQQGTNDQVEHAAEIAMEHNLGMTCDPIGGLVQIPCIERNGMGAVKAINASRLAMHETEGHKLSLDQIIHTMYQTGMDMQSRYKETSLAGLALNIIEC
jgi:L-serine dehydratase